MPNDFEKDQPRNTNTVLYTVIVEWNGHKPPTTYYNRLRKMGFYVRGTDREEGVLQSRISRGQLATGSTTQEGVILQEGAILTHSESTARIISRLAYTLGAVNVILGESILTAVSTATDADSVIIAALESIAGKRGRPTKETAEADDLPEAPEANENAGPQPNRRVKAKHAIYCLDEMIAINTTAKERKCPQCGGYNLITMTAPAVTYKPTPSLPETWSNSRHETDGTYRPAKLDPAATTAAPETMRVNNIDRETIDSATAGHLSGLYAMQQIDADSACRLLDFTRAAIQRYNQTPEAERAEEESTRLRARIDMITRYIQRGGKTPPALAITDHGNPDSFDSLAYAARLNSFANEKFINQTLETIIKSEQ